MPRLAKTNTVVAVDLRGAGHSDCPQDGYDKVTHGGLWINAGAARASGK
jgi:pimeloyl-ACP methyl ester carboxylesterase